MSMLDNRSYLNKTVRSLGLQKGSPRGNARAYTLQAALHRLILPPCESPLELARLAGACGLSAGRVDELVFGRSYELRPEELEQALDLFRSEGIEACILYLHGLKTGEEVDDEV